MNKAKLRKIQQLAQQELSSYDGTLSNFGGSADEWNQFGGYGGLDFVDFDGADGAENAAGAFPQEVRQVQVGKRRMFQFTVTNLMPNDSQDFYLSEGLDYEQVGTILEDDAALGSIGAVGTIDVKGLLKNIKYFRNFFRENPTRVLGFKVSATTSLQIETNVDIEVDSPFHQTLKSRQIVLADYQNENTYRDKVVTVPEQFQLDRLTKVRMTIAPDTSMTVTLYIGAVLSPSKALHKLAAKASGGVDYSTSMLSDKAAAYGLSLGM